MKLSHLYLTKVVAVEFMIHKYTVSYVYLRPKICLIFGILQ